MMGLSENRIYVTSNDVPADILNWARGKVGSNFTKNIVIRQEQRVEVNMPWHEADRIYWQFFKLIDSKTVQMVGDEVGRSGLEGDGNVTGKEVNGYLNVPSGYVLAAAGTYPVRLDLYTSGDAMKPISEPGVLDNLSIDECIILLQAKGLKSPYRTKYPDNLYTNLINQGYLASNRSVTVKGRNLANSPELMDKLDKYAEENGLYFSTGSYKMSQKY
jgi:hypothetical protein